MERFIENSGCFTVVFPGRCGGRAAVPVAARVTKVHLLARTRGVGTVWDLS